jgi:hypothetical protein
MLELFPSVRRNFVEDRIHGEIGGRDKSALHEQRVIGVVGTRSTPVKVEFSHEADLILR